jgi:hypothetical protein
MSYAERAAYPGKTEDSVAGKPLRVRLLYALGVGALGYFTFNALILLGVTQFIYIAVNKSKNEEIARFSRNLLSYLGEVLAFMLFLDDTPPFPFAPFPGNETSTR